jgi:hypothetical protein
LVLGYRVKGAKNINGVKGTLNFVILTFITISILAYMIMNIVYSKYDEFYKTFEFTNAKTGMNLFSFMTSIKEVSVDDEQRNKVSKLVDDEQTKKVPINLNVPFYNEYVPNEASNPLYYPKNQLNLNSNTSADKDNYHEKAQYGLKTFQLIK